MRSFIIIFFVSILLSLSGCQQKSENNIILSGEKHLISASDSIYEYEIDESFKAAEEHPEELSLISVYAPDKDSWNENDLPNVCILQDEWISYAVQQYKDNGTFENAIETEAADGSIFLFKATIEYYGNMMYLYCYEKDNICFCINYPMDYVGTENETILKNVLDEAAHSFRIK